MVQSICICGPSPTVIGGWTIITRPWGDDSRYVNIHQETGQRIEGIGALYHRRFMSACGVPYEVLDKRSWIWTAWDIRTDPMTKLYCAWWPVSKTGLGLHEFLTDEAIEEAQTKEREHLRNYLGRNR